MFAGLSAIVVDEAHALAGTKRGDQLALCMSRLAALAPEARRVGLSATVAHPQALRAWLSPTAQADQVKLVETRGGAAPVFALQLPEGGCPGAGIWVLPRRPISTGGSKRRA
jgi:ATP-dependent Lhr-like helicase